VGSFFVNSLQYRGDSTAIGSAELLLAAHELFK
jgi:hypothetical protein